MANEVDELISLRLTHEQVLDYVNAKTKSHQCANCFENNWNVVIDEQSELGLASVRRDGSFPIPPAMLPTTVLVCAHCGYIKVFAKRAILEWLKTRSNA